METLAGMIVAFSIIFGTYSCNSYLMKLGNEHVASHCKQVKQDCKDNNMSKAQCFLYHKKENCPFK